ncbi:MAG: XRE family transcriptional regulator [Victivallales bacterium]|nr:XRE family transcriptional regulator [Victivallales bacterium]
MKLGQRIKKIRKQHGSTLQEISDMCGFSKSLLSKIESAKTSPPVATISKIAKALGVSLTTLLEETDEVGTVFTPAAKATNLTKTDMGYFFFTFASKRLDKKIMPFMFVAEKGKVKQKLLSHSGEEFVYILEGSMNYKVGSVEYTLGPGDSLYFDAIEEHCLQPITTKVVYLGIFAEN